MPTVDHGRQQVLFKLVYYGPGLGGKTTNLEWVHGHTRHEHRGKLLALNNESERTLFFDLLPIFLGTFKGYQIRLQLCTVPGQVAYDQTRRMILRHVDGVVFVVDSQRDVLDANVQSLWNLGDNLRLQHVDPDELPVAVQYNKRDLPGVASVPELHAALGIREGVPEVEAVAVRGVGVFETVKAITRECLKLVGDPRGKPQGRTPSILPGVRASMYPDAVVRDEASRGEGPLPGDVPRAPRVPEV